MKAGPIELGGLRTPAGTYSPVLLIPINNIYTTGEEHAADGAVMSVVFGLRVKG